MSRKQEHRPSGRRGGVRLQIRLQFLLFSGAGRCTVGYNHRTVITAQTAGITRKNPAALENQRPRESSRQSVLRASLRLAPKARPEPGASYGLLGRAAFGEPENKKKNTLSARLSGTSQHYRHGFQACTQNQIEAQRSGFDLERSRDKMSERWLLEKSHRERYDVRGDVSCVDKKDASTAEGQNRPSGRRRKCAVRAFCRRQNLGAGGIHFRRALKSPKGGAGLWPVEPTKKDMTHGHVLFYGDPSGIRTPDPLLKRQLLCLLS